MASDLHSLYRSQFGSLVASLTRLTGDISTAEDAIQDAFAKATARWKPEDIPTHAVAWLRTTARNGAIDQMRRSAALNARLPQIAQLEEIDRSHATASSAEPEDEGAEICDDMLRLIFTCCHPALNIDARVALCLSTVCGLHTREIARAFIVSEATMSQRLWRAKRKIRDAGIAYRVPQREELDHRLDAVLASIYLIFNEGWLASSGEDGQRTSLAEEALRLARLLTSLLKANAECRALLGLLLVQHSRRRARFDDQGQLVLLRDQDRSLWDDDDRREGLQLIRAVFQSGNGNSRYALMGAIACVHATAPDSSSTDWNEIVTLYEHLMDQDPSAVVALNHAVAIGERDGAHAGLQKVLLLSESATMQRYYLFHSTQAEFLRRLGDQQRARVAYANAIALAENEVERDFLNRQLATLHP